MGGIHSAIARQDGSDDEIVLGVLDAIEQNPSITQRSVASELGIALGLANAYLKRCVRKGLIKVGQAPRRRYAYYLTPQGFAEKSRLTATYLSHSFSFFRKARAQCADVFAAAVARRQHRIALLGVGDLAEIASLVAREYPIEVVAVMPASNLSSISNDLATLGRVDAVIITALTRPQEVFEEAVSLFGDERVYAPALLRLRAGGQASEGRPA
jgi:DNA-binding MarR family transcriptional regulator